MREPRYPRGMLSQVDAALAAHPVEPRDAAAAELARTYAAAIDEGADLSKVGPALLAALEALGLSPRARKAVKTDGQQPAANPLDQLAAARSRKRRPADRDAAAP
jgi:hypothetical protein